MRPARSDSHTHDVAVLTARVRWVVIALLLASLPATDHLLALPVRYGVAGCAIAVVTLLNVALARRAAPLGEGLLSLTVAVDMAAIAVVLGASGGAANPMSALLLVYVALAAAMFSAKAAFGLAAFAACTFGALFLLPDDASCHAVPPGDAAFSRHLYGMWAAFALVAALVAAFVVEVRRAFRARDAELEKLRATSEAAARFAAIGTLAAGVAHELGTPLATIQVLAADLKDVDTARGPILDQVERCRAVLRRLHPSASGDESCSAPVDLGQSVRAAVETWRAGHPSASVEVDIAGDCMVRLEREDVEAAMHVLLDNAHHAIAIAKSAAPIRVSTGLDETRGPYMEVEDDGAGIDPSVKERLGEPFLSTKAPGEGMGLGIYLVRTLLAELGGNIDVTPRLPRGTRVRVCFGVLERVVA